jgi:uncharacterized protein (DUF1330 family)
MNSLTQEITKTIKVEIVSTNKEDISNERIWAINWFNYKQEWLYSLYNRLATPSVIKVGGELLFKGHNQKTIFGDEKLKRHTLLIVTYPKIKNFLEMLTIKAFQIVSLLRVKAVKDFVFGFTKRVDSFISTATPNLEESKSYLVYHYQGIEKTRELYDLASVQGGSVYFHGEKIAQVKRIEEGKDDVLAPFFMDGIILFEFNNEESVEEFGSNSWFEQQKISESHHYAAIFDRIK